MENIIGKKIVVWFSCGAASAVAAKLTIDKYGSNNDILLVNNPILEEHPDNLRFLADCEKWLGMPIHSAVNSKYKSCSVVEVWEDKQYMSGIDGAPCTLLLKKHARYEWEIKNRPDYTVMGFTSEERKRYDNFRVNERPATIFVLENHSKADCFNVLIAAGISLPEIYNLGYPNANCIGCPKATSPTYWNHVRSVHPDIFESRSLQSRSIGARLVRVKGKRIFLDELKVSDKGRSMKNLDFECGIFCVSQKK